MDNSKTSGSTNNGQDKKLSEAFKEILENRKGSSKVEDPLFSILMKAREADIEEREWIPVEGKKSTWNTIHQTITESNVDEKETKKEATITPLHTRRQWLKVAAAIVLLACSSILLIYQFSTPDQLPVAEATNSIQTIELDDGSSVTLRPNSQLFELRDSENERAYSLSGEAVFNVVSSPERLFAVEAGSGRVVVTGTRFNVSSRSQTSRVYLFEGQVRFENEDGTNSVSLAPGEASEIDESNQIQDPFQFDAETVTGWTQNLLTFRDRLAGSIIEELEFHFDVQINAPASIREESLGGTIQLDSVDQSLSDLGRVLGGTFEEVRNDTYEFRPTDN
jgi:ferric-dicitrate binding protein FerR (iron transport regulator)